VATVGQQLCTRKFCQKQKHNRVPIREGNCGQPGPGPQPKLATHSSPPATTTVTGGQSPGSSATPSHLPRPPSATLLRTLPSWNYSEVVVGSNLCFLPLFFFLWVREVALPPKPWRISGGMWSPGPQQLMFLWSGAPSPGTACSLELSLPSPAGIWFKTLLPVGGTNTAALILLGEMVSQHPRGIQSSTLGFRGRECGGHQRLEQPRNTH